MEGNWNISFLSGYLKQYNLKSVTANKPINKGPML